MSIVDVQLVSSPKPLQYNVSHSAITAQNVTFAFDSLLTSEFALPQAKILPPESS